jgi:hypothetical protein
MVAWIRDLGEMALGVWVLRFALLFGLVGT